MQNFIYLRVLKQADHTVFGVDSKGQKTYRDPQFGRKQPYSSGQQVKRSIMESIMEELNESFSPTTFMFDLKAVKKNGDSDLKEGEAFGTADPSDVDQLLGGWMKAEKKSENGESGKILKRRSGFSISAMRPLHPKLATLDTEDLTFDRSNRPDDQIVIIRDAKGSVLAEEEVRELTEDLKSRSFRRKWVPENTRASGLFVHDLAIDLRTLFAVSLNPNEPAITEETEAKLREQGWVETKNSFGACLVAPKELRERLIPAIAKALVNWRIHTNQSRTFSLMETMAVSVSNNANKVASAIRSKLTEDNNRVVPVVDDQVKGAQTFINAPASRIIVTNNESAEALDEAEQYLAEQMLAYPYESQLA